METIDPMNAEEHVIEQFENHDVRITETDKSGVPKYTVVCNDCGKATCIPVFRYGVDKFCVNKFEKRQCETPSVYAEQAKEHQLTVSEEKVSYPSRIRTIECRKCGATVTTKYLPADAEGVHRSEGLLFSEELSVIECENPTHKEMPV